MFCEDPKVYKSDLAAYNYLEIHKKPQEMVNNLKL